MCERLSELRRAVCRYAAAFEPELVSGPDATKVMQEASAIERAAATLKALAATRVADTSAWQGEGDRSAAHHLARKSGTTVSQAADAIKTAQRLKNLPAASAAARRGELSPEQASAIASAATANPGSEKRLVQTAKKSSLQELRNEAARVRAAAESEDAEARRKRIHAKRSLREWTDPEGVWNMHVQNNPEVGARIMAVLRAKVDEIFRRARAEGRREPLEAYGADALDEVIAAYGAGDVNEPESPHAGPEPDDEQGAGSEERGGTGGPWGGAPPPQRSEDGGEGPGGSGPVPPGTTATPAPEGTPASKARRARKPVLAKVIVRLDFAALLRGRALGDEVCEIAGFGPVAVSAVREMIESGNAILAAVVTNGVKVTGVAHLRRRANAWEQTALEWLYPTCAAEGCSATARLQNDHRDDWSKTHITAFDGLDRLCPPMHQLKTRENWSLVEGIGKRAFVPPSDPRHPNNAKAVANERPPPAADISPPEAA